MKSFLRFALASMLILATFPSQSVAETNHPTRGSDEITLKVPPSIITLEGNGASPLLAQIDTVEGIRDDQRQALKELIGFLPAACSEKIRTLTIRYDHPASRGLAGKDTVIVSGNVSIAEFRALLAHEMFGHLVDLGCLTGTAASGDSVFPDGNTPTYADDPSVLFYQISWSSPKTLRADATARDFVSGYAFKADVFEDEAETVAFYFLHKAEFERMARANPALARKLQWVETYVFPNVESYAWSDYRWRASAIPWDVTKLPYEWYPPREIAVR
jgi:hypothetical protein